LVLLELQQLQHWINLPLLGVDGFDEAIQLLHATNGAEASATFTYEFAGGTLANPVNLNYYMTGLFGY
jgi:hypothetical protein